MASPTPPLSDSAGSSSLSLSSLPSSSNENRLHCDLLSIVKASQLGNGIRHNDYDRYRAYLSRRLHRLRVSTKLTNARTHRDFKYKSLEAKQLNDDRHLLIPLMLSERSWAYAMSLKSQMDLNKDLKRKRFHRIKRLTKAAFWAKHLYELCLAKADSRTQLEATAYYYYHSGSLHLAREEHGVAYGDFLKSKHVFDQLKSVANTALQSICEERATQLEPILRFCKYMADKANKDKNNSGAPVVDGGLSDLPPEITNQLKELSKESESVRLIAHATALLDATDKEIKTTQSKRRSVPCLASRSQTFTSGSASDHHHLVDFPPSLSVAPSKPILFDLAFNAIQYPDITAKANAKSYAPAPAEQKQSIGANRASASVASSKDQPQQQAGGGFLSRWWGGGGK